MLYKRLKIQLLSMEVSSESNPMCLVPKYDICLEYIWKASSLTTMGAKTELIMSWGGNQISGGFQGTWYTPQVSKKLSWKTSGLVYYLQSLPTFTFLNSIFYLNIFNYSINQPSKAIHFFPSTLKRVMICYMLNIFSTLLCFGSPKIINYVPQVYRDDRHTQKER